MKTHTFSAEDFDAFEAYVYEFIKKLNITGWRVEVKHEHVGNGTCADIRYNVASQSALIRLTETVEYDFAITTNVNKLAKHEVLHLLLAHLIWTAARSGEHCSDEVVAQEHNVINRLLEVL